MSDVFISYSSRDRAVSKAIADALRVHGISVFYDIEIKAGALWDDVVNSALQESEVILVLWSSASISSEWVLSEADIARKLGKLFPVLIENVYGTPHCLDQYSVKIR